VRRAAREARGGVHRTDVRERDVAGAFGTDRAMPTAKSLKKARDEGEGDLTVARDESWRSHSEEED